MHCHLDGDGRTEGQTDGGDCANAVGNDKLTNSRKNQHDYVLTSEQQMSLPFDDFQLRDTPDVV